MAPGTDGSPGMLRAPRVALLIETARGYGRGLLQGFVRYGRLHGPWTFYLSPGDFEQVVPRMEEWRGTGIIARVETPEIGKALLATRLPVVALDLSESQSGPGSPLSGFSEVASDSRSAARLAAEHLLERGFRQYAFVGIPGRVWSERREQSFRERVQGAGIPCNVYQPPRLRRDREWGHEHGILAAWLHALSKPVGIMACNDDRGRQVLEACRTAGVAVPEEIAVVGVDNDELLCELADPPLSSVALDTERGGYEAAQLLDGLMSGRVRQPARILVEPLGVVTRRSTDVVAAEDREVAAAVRWIRDRARRGPLRVGEVAQAVKLSRRSLEVRFRAALGRSVRAEIERVRLEHARSLLAETDLPTSQVAELSGFGSPSYLAMVFRRKFRRTPTRYREEARGPSRQGRGDAEGLAQF